VFKWLTKFFKQKPIPIMLKDYEIPTHYTFRRLGRPEVDERAVSALYRHPRLPKVGTTSLPGTTVTPQPSKAHAQLQSYKAYRDIRTKREELKLKAIALVEHSTPSIASINARIKALKALKTSLNKKSNAKKA
jgi:hypothetical protein